METMKPSEGPDERTAVADEVIDIAGQPSEDGVFLRQVEQAILHGTTW